MIMKLKIALPLMAAPALISCDAAMEQVGGQVRMAVVEQCLQTSESFGIGESLVAPVCECTADTFMEKNAQDIADIDQSRIAEIVRQCAQDAGADTMEAAGG